MIRWVADKAIPDWLVHERTDVQNLQARVDEIGADIMGSSTQVSSVLSVALVYALREETERSERLFLRAIHNPGYADIIQQRGDNKYAGVPEDSVGDRIALLALQVIQRDHLLASDDNRISVLLECLANAPAIYELRNPAAEAPAWMAALKSLREAGLSPVESVLIHERVIVAPRWRNLLTGAQIEERYSAEFPDIIDWMGEENIDATVALNRKVRDYAVVQYPYERKFLEALPGLSERGREAVHAWSEYLVAAADTPQFDRCPWNTWMKPEDAEEVRRWLKDKESFLRHIHPADYETGAILKTPYEGRADLDRTLRGTDVEWAARRKELRARWHAALSSEMDLRNHDPPLEELHRWIRLTYSLGHYDLLRTRMLHYASDAFAELGIPAEPTTGGLVRAINDAAGDIERHAKDALRRLHGS